MDDPRQLARMLAELEDQLTTCMRCGLCQSVCPLYAQTGREADVARGKLALLDGLAKEMLTDAQGVKERLDHCLLCGSCAANCPSGVKVLDIFLKARAILAGYQGLSPIKKFIFRGLLAKPELFNRLMSLAPSLQGLLAKPASELLGTSCARIQWPLGKRHFRRLAAKPFHALVHGFSLPAPAGAPRVGFFVGCLVDKIFPEIGQAVVRSLVHHGVGLSVPDGQACCGMPALSSGDTQAFASMVRRNLELFPPEELDYLVTACATCTSAIKKLWPLMIADAAPDLRERVEALAGKAIDISQLLVDKLPGGITNSQSAGPERAVTYHDPCHLRKSLGVAAQPRALIEASPGCRLAEMPASDACCGMGGSFNLLHYEESAAMGQRKLESILASGAEMVATSCPACMLQISDALSQAQRQLPVRHVVQLYAQGLPACPQEGPPG